MIKSTKTSLKFLNIGKHSKLTEFIHNYKLLLGQFIDLLWEERRVPNLLPKEITAKVSTQLSARIIQCAGKQASGIVRGTRRKQEKREFKINDFIKKGYFKKARKLQKVYDRVKMSKPILKLIQPELDQRFVKIDLNNKTSFDGWVTLTSLYKNSNITIPFKKTRHFNKMQLEGKLKSGIRLSNKELTFMFEIPEPTPKLTGTTLGIDIGKSSLLSCSDGSISCKNKHGHDLNSILMLMCRKKKGSNGFKRVEEHRKNYINWSVNRLNLSSTSQINIESLRGVRKFKRSSGMLSHWVYRPILLKLKDYAYAQGVLVRECNPTYTSQRCSKCGWVRKSNRKGKLFKCTSSTCGFMCDADLNASLNLSLPLPPITSKQRLKHANIRGFYWYVLGQEPIVPVTPETQIMNILL